MRRSAFAVLGTAAILVFAACTDRPNDRALIPTEPSLAPGGGGGSKQCNGGLAADIGSQQDAYFDSNGADALASLFGVIKAECVRGTTLPSATVLAYLQKVLDLRGVVDTPRAQNLAAHWNAVTEYATGTPIGAPIIVFVPGVPPNFDEGVRGGGARVLEGNSAVYDTSMTTWDGRAGVAIHENQSPTGPHLVTLDPTGCPVTSLIPATDECYTVAFYPPVTSWSPLMTFGMCLDGGSGDNTAITHFETGFGTEVLPEGAATFPWGGGSCASTHTFMDTWLGRKAGPLGRALARTIDYLRPQPLFAVDAGETGETDAASPFSAAKTIIADDNFDNENLGPFLNGTDPTVGHNPTSWDIFAPSPGFVEIQNGSVLAPNGGLPGNVVVISQALGACKKNCPEYRLLLTRVNPGRPIESQPAPLADEIGTYQVTWQSMQTKPNIKEAPFVLLSASGIEIARLSYVSQSNQNRILFNGDPTGKFWTQNVAQAFKIIVRLDDDGVVVGTDPTPDYTATLYINDMNTPVAGFINVPLKSNQKTFSTLGYKLSGVDAGVMAADNFLVRRLADKP